MRQEQVPRERPGVVKKQSQYFFCFLGNESKMKKKRGCPERKANNILRERKEKKRETRDPPLRCLVVLEFKVKTVTKY